MKKFVARREDPECHSQWIIEDEAGYRWFTLDNPREFIETRYGLCTVYMCDSIERANERLEEIRVSR